MAGKSLLDLPAEIRNTIYRLAVVENEPLAASVATRVARARESSQITNGARRTVTQTKRYPKTPALTHVSKQVREEALPVFFGLNTFLFDVTKYEVAWPIITVFDHWTNNIPVRRSNIRRISLDFEVLPAEDSARMLSSGQHPAAVYDQITIVAVEGEKEQFEIIFGGDQESTLRRECTCGLERWLRAGRIESDIRDALALAENFLHLLQSLMDGLSRAALAREGEICEACQKPIFDKGIGPRFPWSTVPISP